MDWFDEKLAARAAAIAEGSLEPAAARDAATVVIARQAPSGAVEILMLKRPASMAFAAGAYVFPGGRVDPSDSDPRIGWHGPSPEEFGVRLGAPPDAARSLVVAAVRETYEEAGLLLAGTPDGRAVNPSGPDWDADREAIRAGELSFADLLASRGLVIGADRIVPWARWVTPAAEPRRYDTRFFAVVAPAGQTADGHLAEADQIAWISPDDALKAARAGEITLLPPTAATLTEFAALTGDVAGFLAQPRAIAPIEPRIMSENGQAWLELPEEVRYPL
ncbi:MAG: NUDIX domain-containing protein [Nocardiopsaceae bacterium]|nr:NUDIX domain-containing protein [Nocardiopsaceae bacterium]